VTSAENQQERLSGFPDWVVGFVDGEGCFSIGFVRQPCREGRKGYATGFQVSHEFVVTQGERSLDVLHELRDFFGVGQVIATGGTTTTGSTCTDTSCGSATSFSRRWFRFSRSIRLRTSKRHNFEKFAECVEMISAGRHLTVDGLIQIASITETMNRKKPRQDLIRILRDCTPETLDTGSWDSPICMATCRGAASKEVPFPFDVPEKGESEQDDQRNSLSGKFRPARMA
jgi:LAGLIDADG endonuclease